MAEAVIAIVTIASGLGAAAALRMAFRHHWRLVAGCERGAE